MQKYIMVLSLWMLAACAADHQASDNDPFQLGYVGAFPSKIRTIGSSDQTTSTCIGNPSKAVCLVETIIACNFRNDVEPCFIEPGTNLSHRFAALEKQKLEDFLLEYRIESITQLAPFQKQASKRCDQACIKAQSIWFSQKTVEAEYLHNIPPHIISVNYMKAKLADGSDFIIDYAVFYHKGKWHIGTSTLRVANMNLDYAAAKDGTMIKDPFKLGYTGAFPSAERFLSTPEFTTSNCIGKVDTLTCYVETHMACFRRFDQESCQPFDYDDTQPEYDFFIDHYRIEFIEQTAPFGQYFTNYPYVAEVKKGLIPFWLVAINYLDSVTEFGNPYLVHYWMIYTEKDGWILAHRSYEL